MPLTFASTSTGSETYAIALVAVAVLLLLLVIVGLERRRRNRRFSRRLARYERRRAPGDGQILDPNDRPHG